MTGYKKKVIVFLVTAALASGIVLLQTSGSSAGEGVSTTRTSENRSSKGKAGGLFPNDRNMTLQETSGSSIKKLFGKTMVSVLLVIVLGSSAVFVSKRLLPKISNRPGKEIHIIETAHLGPRKMVHLLRVGNQRLLVGSTNENITILANVTDTMRNLPA